MPTIGLNWIIAVINKLSKGLFYGELLIKFEKGNVVFCKKSKTMKPE